MGGLVDGILGGDDAAGDAAAVQARATREATAEQRRQFDLTRDDLSPFLQAGTGALTQEQALLGLSGQQAQQRAIDEFSLRPDQQFIRQQGEQALVRNAAATGGLGGGNVLKELQTFGQGTASQALSEQLNRLSALRTGGQSTGTSLGAFGAQSASNIGSNIIAGGQAQASGILGAQQANAGLAETAIGLGSLFLSDRSLKKNLTKVNRLASGLYWYVWEWNEKGKELTGRIFGEGVIAQEAKELFPDAVDCSGEYMKVDYMRLA